MGAAVSVALARAPSRSVILGAGALALFTAFVRWPWAVLPASIVGGTLVASLVGAVRVSDVVGLHVGLAALGVAGLLTRRVIDPEWRGRATTSADLPMVLVGIMVVLGAAYGLARGNAPQRVAVAAYEIGVVPVYFFIATSTLSRARHLRAAGALAVTLAAVLALVGLASPGRHGGLFSLIVLPPLLVSSAASSAARRTATLGLAAIFALDVALSGYRAVWLAGAIATLFLLADGPAWLRRIIAGTAIVAALMVLGASLVAGGVHSRASTAADALHQPAGYRVSEAAVGVDALLESPLVGGGLGQVSRDVFINDLGRTDVGPVYHVFYVMVLANAGIVGLAIVLWSLWTALRGGRGTRARAFRTLLAGFIVAAAFAGPTDGHWELGLLAALTLLETRFAAPEALVGEATP
jgi:hypothetical protein